VTITRFHSTGRCLWEGARRRIQKGTAANRTIKRYWFSQPNATVRRHSRRTDVVVRFTYKPTICRSTVKCHDRQ